MMSVCFTWFPIGGYRRIQYITSIDMFYKNVLACYLHYVQEMFHAHFPKSALEHLQW